VHDDDPSVGLLPHAALNLVSHVPAPESLHCLGGAQHVVHPGSLVRGEGEEAQDER
jgi:hypothetical protein